MQILRLPFFTMCQEEFSRCMKTRLCNDSERGCLTSCERHDPGLFGVLRGGTGAWAAEIILRSYAPVEVLLHSHTPRTSPERTTKTSSLSTHPSSYVHSVATSYLRNHVRQHMHGSMLAASCQESLSTVSDHCLAGSFAYVEGLTSSPEPAFSCLAFLPLQVLPYAGHMVTYIREKRTFHSQYVMTCDAAA